IMPAGAKILPLRSNIPAISDFVFCGIDEGFAKRSREKKGGIIVGGDNYGQGSSREHAALAPRYLGVVAKIAKSFARIHKANLVNFGIIPLTFADTNGYELLQQGDQLEIPDIRAAISQGKTEIVVIAKGQKIRTRLDVSERQRKALLAGGVLNIS
ncbi:MAG: aconitate hydratase, partial [Planctomycetota bacterium]